MCTSLCYSGLHLVSSGAQNSTSKAALYLIHWALGLLSISQTPESSPASRRNPVQGYGNTCRKQINERERKTSDIFVDYVLTVAQIIQI
ncbi:hypothetical protein JOB18_040965 [Solea senegalensis]|uniref:Uncharacterized protein n=1 Tax=Solea senegalensis TaxID=28829 RepID=A0AAV6SMB5_SOLSE|nr:hypothetical protein JOB18_040965 [Solea senegalensis]